MKTFLPIKGIAYYDSSEIDTAYFTTVYLGNYVAGNYSENVGSHCGVDIDANKYYAGKTDVFAVMDGSVEKLVENDPAYGNYIVLRHSNCEDFHDPSKKTTYYSCYTHLSSVTVLDGQPVIGGQKIGVTGTSGNSTNPHLHFQIDCAGAPFHPYWPFTTAEASAEGYSFVEAVNHGLNKDKAALHTINPLVYVQKYLNGGAPIFSDIDDGDPDFVAINYLKDKGVVQGYPDGSFMPGNSINRAEFVKLSFKAFDYILGPVISSSFPDVKTSDWFFKYVETAKRDGIVRGYPDGKFKPANDISRAEALKVLLEAKRVSVPTAVNSTGFTDVAVSDWFAPYVKAASDAGYIEKGSVFEPHVNATRRVAARWAYNMRG